MKHCKAEFIAFVVNKSVNKSEPVITRTKLLLHAAPQESAFLGWRAKLKGETVAPHHGNLASMVVAASGGHCRHGTMIGEGCCCCYTLESPAPFRSTAVEKCSRVIGSVNAESTTFANRWPDFEENLPAETAKDNDMPVTSLSTTIKLGIK